MVRGTPLFLVGLLFWASPSWAQPFAADHPNEVVRAVTLDGASPAVLLVRASASPGGSSGSSCGDGADCGSDLDCSGAGSDCGSDGTGTVLGIGCVVVGAVAVYGIYTLIRKGSCFLDGASPDEPPAAGPVAASTQRIGGVEVPVVPWTGRPTTDDLAELGQAHDASFVVLLEARPVRRGVQVAPSSASPAVGLSVLELDDQGPSWRGGGLDRAVEWLLAEQVGDRLETVLATLRFP